MKYFLIILSCIFICFSACEKTQSKKIIPEQDVPAITINDSLLSEDFGYAYLGRISSEEREVRNEQSRILYFEFLELYQNNEFEAAIPIIEAIIELVPHGVYYYYYGNCFMELGNYEYAEKAFLKAIKMFDWIFNPWFQIGYGSYPEKDFRFTYDHNGVPREGYFTYYNLACTYSLTNKLDLAFNYLTEALEYSFPYIDHLYNDPDLENLFNSSNDIKSRIQKKYDDGFVNTFSETAYYYGRASMIDRWFFTDTENVYNEKYMYVRYGKYEIRNYSIVINYHLEEGSTGVNIIPGGGVEGAYEYYEDYENEINQFEIINIKDFSDVWEEIPFN
jgi:tetratricopeptide (TPR) repeat protein